MGGPLDAPVTDARLWTDTRPVTKTYTRASAQPRDEKCLGFKTDKAQPSIWRIDGENWPPGKQKVGPCHKINTQHQPPSSPDHGSLETTRQLSQHNSVKEASRKKTLTNGSRRQKGHKRSASRKTVTVNHLLPTYRGTKRRVWLIHELLVACIHRLPAATHKHSHDALWNIHHQDISASVPFALSGLRNLWQ